jgi:anaerobic ribonucleoside-triphosphate reductase activating protein
MVASFNNGIFKMNYASILRCDVANGPGFRVSLFVSGCLRKCPGCFNEIAQDPSYGKKFDSQAKEKIFKELSKEYCSGLSLLGGEPMSKLSNNREAVIELCKETKEKFPEKNIWMWSGYTFEELISDPTSKNIFNYIDVLVDGPFIESEKDLDLAWKGSRNQRVIDVKKTTESGNIVVI